MQLEERRENQSTSYLGVREEGKPNKNSFRNKNRSIGSGRVENKSSLPVSVGFLHFNFSPSVETIRTPGFRKDSGVEKT